MDSKKQRFLQTLRRLCDSGALVDAVSLCREYLQAEPEDIEAWYRLGVIKGVLNDGSGAIECFSRVLTLSPANVDARYQLGKSFKLAGDYAAAREQFEALLGQVDSPCRLQFELGEINRILGRFAEAEACFRAATTLCPTLTEAFQSLASIKRFSSADDPDIQAMEKVWQTSGLSNAQTIRLNFALAKAYDDSRDYGRAFTALAEGNRLRRLGFDYDVGGAEQRLEQIQQTFSAEFFRQREGLGLDSRVPLFIIGMPRSGSTLVEQILSCHPDVYSAGEISDFVRLALPVMEGKAVDAVRSLGREYYQNVALAYLDGLQRDAGSAIRVSDKALSNYQWLGLIRVMFPNARVIHCRRAPMDNCLSIFQKNFTAAHHYAYDLTELGRYYLAYARLMRHWERVLPGYVYTLNYEDLITDQASETRRLLEYCSLDWDESCLAFHNSDRPVRTASLAQVRRPLYTSSLSKWRNYQPYLQPLERLLTDAGA